LLHILVDDLSAQNLTDVLRARGIHVLDVRPIKPSLEDVFVSRIRAGQAAASH
jgi:hypothetical protein